MAGVVGLEPANPFASYLIGIPGQLRLKEAQARRPRPFACELRVITNLQLGPRFQQKIFSDGLAVAIRRVL